MTGPPAVLFFDTGSPLSSVALGGHGEVLACRTIEQRRTSERLLAAIDEVLVAAGVELTALHGIAALQGPGSFTGLRIGLATALGLHQALQVRATALPTLPILAAAAGPGDREVLAAVDAIRGDWVIQRFTAGAGEGCRPPEPLSEPELLAGEALRELGPCRLAAYGTEVLRRASWFAGAGIELVDPPPLAAVAARWLSAEAIDWLPERLSSPIYFRPPAVTSAGG